MRSADLVARRAESAAFSWFPSRTLPSASAGRTGAFGAAPVRGTDQGESLALLTLGERDQREDAVGDSDLDVVPFAHGDHQGVGGGRDDGVAVGVGDGEPVSGEGDPEGGVGAGVDDPDPHLLPGLGGEYVRGVRDPPVGQVVG